MKDKIKIYIVSNEHNGYYDYPNWITNHVITKNLNDADLVLFAGGSDVSPFLYGETAHDTTSTDVKRDFHEVKIFDEALKLNKPMLGICRGSQFMCVMAGGRLVQNQDNPKYLHTIKIEEKDELYLMTSTHHQAQYPYNLPENEYKIIGYTEGNSKFHQDGLNNEMNPVKECEIVYYPKTNALAIQGHPEKMFNDSDFWTGFNGKDTAFNAECTKTLTFCNELVTDLLNNKL